MHVTAFLGETRTVGHPQRRARLRDHQCFFFFLIWMYQLLSIHVLANINFKSVLWGERGKVRVIFEYWLRRRWSQFYGLNRRPCKLQVAVPSLPWWCEFPAFLMGLRTQRVYHVSSFLSNMKLHQTSVKRGTEKKMKKKRKWNDRKCKRKIAVYRLLERSTTGNRGNTFCCPTLFILPYFVYWEKKNK